MLTQASSRQTNFTAELPLIYWFLWLGTLINRLGGFVIPFLTFYLTNRRGLDVNQAALMVALFGAGSFTSALVGGELSDRLGRRPTMMLSLLVAPAAMLMLGFARAVPLIAAYTLMLGFFTDLYRPAVNASVADLVPLQVRTRAYGYLYWAINIGAALAPMLAGLIAKYNYLLLFIGDAVTTLIFGLIVLWRVSETRPAVVYRAANPSFGKRVRQAWREPLLLAFTSLGFVFGTIYMQSYVTLPIDMQAHGMTPVQYGFVIGLNGGLIVLLGIPVSHVASRWTPFRAMAAAALLLGLGFGLTGVSHSLPLYGLSVLVWTLGEIVGASVAPTIIASFAPVELRGLYQGFYSAAWGLSLLSGPVLGGWLYQYLGATALWGGCLALGALLAAGYLILGSHARDRLERALGQDAQLSQQTF